MAYTYSHFSVQSDPVGGSQSIDEDSEESLVVGIHDAHQVRVILSARHHCIIPTQVAGYNPVVVASVLHLGRERVVVSVSWGLGCIYDNKKAWDVTQKYKPTGSNSKNKCNLNSE